MGPRIFHRFRSTDSLLGPRKELENQEIYFAAPEQLNDPVEGFKDICWRGDEIVWENFFRHYLLCLEHVCLLHIIDGKMRLLVKDDIPVLLPSKGLPALPEYHQMHADIEDRFLRDSLLMGHPIGRYIREFAKTPRIIRRDEFLLYMTVIHCWAVAVVLGVFREHGLAPGWAEDKAYIQAGTAMSCMFVAFDSWQKRSGDEVRLLSLQARRMMSQIKSAIVRSNSPAIFDERNMLLIMLDFPEIYVEEIERSLSRMVRGVFHGRVHQLFSVGALWE